VHRHVRRLLEDVEGLEVGPERMGRIRQPAEGEGLGREEVSELVVDVRLRDAEERQGQELPRQRREEDDRLRGGKS